MLLKHGVIVIGIHGEGNKSGIGRQIDHRLLTDGIRNEPHR